MNSSELPCNSEMTLKRLYSTEKRLLKNSELATAYRNVQCDRISLNNATVLVQSCNKI